MKFDNGNQETVGERAKRLYPGVTYDAALPQQWVDAQIAAGFNPLGQVIWAYPPDSMSGQPWPLTETAAQHLRQSDQWADRSRPKGLRAQIFG